MTRNQFDAEQLLPEIRPISDRMNIESGRIPPCRLPELPFSDTVSADEFLDLIRFVSEKPI